MTFFGVQWCWEHLGCVQGPLVMALYTQCSGSMSSRSCIAECIIIVVVVTLSFVVIRFPTVLHMERGARIQGSSTQAASASTTTDGDAGSS